MKWQRRKPPRYFTFECLSLNGEDLDGCRGESQAAVAANSASAISSCAIRRRYAVNSSAKIGYKLISIWPINKQNGPKTEFEQKGLLEILQNPDRPYTEVVMHGGTRLQAIYADRAVSQACIGCHIAHQDSPKQKFKLNDVMGAIMVTVPLSQ